MSPPAQSAELSQAASQAVRLRRFGLAALAYAFGAGLLIAAFVLGMLPAAALTANLAIFAGVNLVLFVVFRSGFNLRFADASLTVLQIVVALTILMQIIYQMDSGRNIALFATFIVFLFGVFRLSAVELRILTLYALAAHALVINLLMHTRPHAIQSVQIEWMSWLMLAAILPFFSVIGGQINSLRRKLRDREAALRRAEHMAALAHVITGPRGEFQGWAETLPSMLGVGPPDLPRNSRDWLQLIHPEDRALFRATALAAAGSGERKDFEYRLRRADDAYIQVRHVMEPLEASARTRLRAPWFNTIQDITGQRQAEFMIRRLNRVYAMLSGTNSVIARVRDREELFKEACRIAVEVGGFRMAWIGVVDRDQMRIVPMARAGDSTGYLEAVQERFSLLDDAPAGHGPSTLAVRSGKSVVLNDIATDARSRHKARHETRGVRALMSLPMPAGEHPVAVLSLHAAEASYFDAGESRLLTELANDIAFAIDNIEKRERLDYLAYYDVLTGLANRSLFLERLTQAMRSAGAKGRKLALFVVDLDRFRNFNDSLGRHAGDALLRQVAAWLRAKAPDASLVARVDADHFAIAMPEVREDGNIVHYVERSVEAFLTHPFRIDDSEFRVAGKVGVALFPEHGGVADTLFKNAEAALKQAKASGDRYLFYQQKMTATVADRLSLENRLRVALSQGEFILQYQPKVSLADGTLTGAEALIRWNDPLTGLVAPGRFIPILEESGLIYDVGRWALGQAAQDALRWRAAGLPALRFAVNVSPLQLRNHAFVAEIRQAAGIGENAGSGLELEITESLVMENADHSVATLKSIRAMGVTVAIDDFGTGYSSLSYLSKLPVDTLKIDRSFVIEMTTRPQGRALVDTIIRLAHSLQLKVVAEGVETEEQCHILQTLRCDEMQGFLVSRAVGFDELAQFARDLAGARNAGQPRYASGTSPAR